MKVDESAKLHITLRGVELTSVAKGWFAVSSPAFKMNAFSLGTSELWTTVATSPRVEQELNPLWPSLTVSLKDLCGCDTDRPVQIAVFDQDKNGAPLAPMGAFETTVSALLRKKVEDINKVDVSKLFTLDQAGKDVGKIVVMDIKLEEPPKDVLKRAIGNVKLASKVGGLANLAPSPSSSDDEKEPQKLAAPALKPPSAPKAVTPAPKAAAPAPPPPKKKELTDRKSVV